MAEEEEKAEKSRNQLKQGQRTQEERVEGEVSESKDKQKERERKGVAIHGIMRFNAAKKESLNQWKRSEYVAEQGRM